MAELHPLERLRLDLDMTWLELADHLGITTVQLWRWRKGTAVPNPLTEARVARKLDISLDAIEEHPWPEWLRDREPAS